VSVIVTIEFPGLQADKFMEAFQRQPERMKRISEDGRSQGAIHHLLTANDDGILIVVDEWDSRENFERFLANQEEIKNIMSEFEPGDPPIICSYRVLDTSDRF
jgi:hypothetical protein